MPGCCLIIAFESHHNVDEKHVIPLDMIFIDMNGRVRNIVQRTVPMSEATIASKGRVRAVLEVNGGTVARLEFGQVIGS